MLARQAFPMFTDERIDILLEQLTPLRLMTYGSAISGNGPVADISM